MTEYSDGFHDWMVDRTFGLDGMSERAYRLAAADAVDAWNDTCEEGAGIGDVTDAVEWWMEQRPDQG